MSDESQNTDKVINAATKIIDLAADSPELSEAGHKFAKSALTIAKAVDNCLLPIAAVNFAFDKARKYFENRFQKDLEKATNDIPAEDLIEPKASVAAPVLQGLAFSHEEQDLKMMYLKLLSSAMDGRKAGSVHPAYAEIIRQLTSDEARLLNQVIDGRPRIPIVTLKGWDQIGITKMHKNILPYSDVNTGEQIAAPKLPSMIDNWQRLELISITYEFHLVATGEYDWVQSRPEYIELKEETEKEVEIEKGIMELTAFGKLFAEAVGKKPKL
ncbi:MAG: DUF4393 domain-containing protein [Candidatus Dadabacteria bacterium]|nr:DUF4393 domain-containing protein [Candidatus Dadabacteria bacterium]MDE0477239.1 DUF4393 domain-containing protein [Candidatus Dadabacteria bacterium]